MYKEDLVSIAKRENNNKRKYLVVNKFQGKHVPVIPHKALDMFKRLAEKLKNEYYEEELLLIGFAETATAIGAALSIELNSKYIQTTREMISDVDFLFFSETHSHATEQKLVKDDIDIVARKIDRIIFVEDEVTTGNTILNIINIMEKLYPHTIKYSVISILNGMNEKAIEKYNERNINIHYLVKTNHESFTEKAESFLGDGKYILLNTDEEKRITNEICVKGFVDARRLIASCDYQKSCLQLWESINKKVNFSDMQNLLVLGTEEFMYPALFVAAEAEKLGIDVRFHATTRSPIAVSSEKDYPLHCRYELKSLYDSNRKTFIYDLDKYDGVLIITDSQNEEKQGINSLINAIRTKNNENIILVRWC